MTSLSNRPSPSRTSIAFVIALALLVSAPVVGDVGACGAVAETLDAQRFFNARLEDECTRCNECANSSPGCRRACDRKTPRPLTFPPGCHPLVHDGEVCLHAIEALSCNAFGDLVSDNPIVPTECDFCPSADGKAGA
ncbi:MAG: hypothetical protein NVS3B20_20010 [Polyangiales bacterium]